MDERVKKAGLAAFASIVLVTLSASIIADTMEAARMGAIAYLFDPFVILASFLLGLLISMLLHWGIEAAHFEKILKLLPSKHQKVLQVLSSCKSSTIEHLCYASKLPKATVAQVISHLHAKDIIRKINDRHAILVESRIFLMQQASEALRRLPGLSEKRLLLSLFTVLLFGMSFSLLNSYHLMALESPLKPTTYLLSLEFIALGVISSLAARHMIAHLHFRRAIMILPEDEQQVLKQIFRFKSITQNELVLATGLYKMKVSRILRKFEEKGLIERISYGYTNLVVSKI